MAATIETASPTPGSNEISTPSTPSFDSSLTTPTTDVELAAVDQKQTKTNNKKPRKSYTKKDPNSTTKKQSKKDSKKEKKEKENNIINDDNEANNDTNENEHENENEIEDEDDIEEGGDSPSKRKSDSLNFPLPQGTLPPRKRAKTETEKEQRRVERILRNRLAAHASREKKRKHVEELETKCSELTDENQSLNEQVEELQKLRQTDQRNLQNYETKFAMLMSLIESARHTNDWSVIDRSLINPMVSPPPSVHNSPRTKSPILSPNMGCCSPSNLVMDDLAMVNKVNNPNNGKEYDEPLFSDSEVDTSVVIKKEKVEEEEDQAMDIDSKEYTHQQVLKQVNKKRKNDGLYKMHYPAEVCKDQQRLKVHHHSLNKLFQSNLNLKLQHH